MKKILIFAGFFAILAIISCSSSRHTYKKSVPGGSAILTLHPTEVSLKGKDGNDYFFIYNFPTRQLFITSEKATFDAISEHLPARMIQGRQAAVDGASIDPFTIFKKKDLENESRRIGLAINNFRVYKIFNYGLMGR